MRGHTQLLTIVGAVVATCLTIQSTRAADPLFLCQNGQPYLWPNGGANIPYNPDQGGLGPLTNAQAVAQVAAALAEWENVSTATVTYTNAGPLPVDVDFTNFGPYLNPIAPDGYSAIVFDETGDIFNYLFGFGSGVLGFASPEWGYIPTCTITEGVAFLNGAEFGDAQVAKDIMVHEFGHYNNLAHTVVNGQIYLGAVGGDNSGPSPHDTFPIPSPYTDVIETLYPFYYDSGVGTSTLHMDDKSSLSALYPTAGFAASTATVTGTIYAPDGVTKLTGVNVIARNIANPFHDAVSAISSGYTDSSSQLDPLVGTYTFRGLTPGAYYAVYVDELLAGGFSTTPMGPLPGPEEFYNGVDESNDGSTDDPAVYAGVSAVAGATASGVDIIFNAPGPGVIPLGDDDNVELALPFPCEVCGAEYSTVFVNSNGSVSFGAGDNDFSESAADMLDGPPRIAGVWDDLNPTTGGYVWFDRNDDEMIVGFNEVPEYYSTGSNTFTVRIHKSKPNAKKYTCHMEVTYGNITATDGLAGFSCGAADTCGYEEESDLSSYGNSRINLNNTPAVYEVFSFSNPNDLEASVVRYNGTNDLKDHWMKDNDTLEDAFFIKLPFDTYNANSRFAEIYPAGGDVDYFSFEGVGGENLIAEITGGNLDTVLGIFDYETGSLLALDDDGGVGLLSRLVFAIPADGMYALAVSSFPDYDFTGDGNSGGRYCLEAYTSDEILLDLGDDDYEMITLPFGFPFQGTTWTSAYVNSNGSITFGAGDTDYSESVYDFLNDRPRVAGLWDDLRPPSGGTISVKFGSDYVRVTFDSIPEYYSTGANTFAMTLHASGDVEIVYGAVSSSDSIVGVTPGLGALDPGETDLSAAGSLSALGTTYELFTFSGPFDLSGETLLFEAP